METSYLVHHGVKGMHWGVRRYQNADGSLTSAGKKRQSESKTNEKKGLSDKTKKNIKTAAKVGAVVAGSALAAYGAYKFHDYIRSENSKLAMEMAKEYLDKNNKYAKDNRDRALNSARMYSKNARANFKDAKNYSVAANSFKGQLDSLSRTERRYRNSDYAKKAKVPLSDIREEMNDLNGRYRDVSARANASAGVAKDQVKFAGDVRRAAVSRYKKDVSSNAKRAKDIYDRNNNVNFRTAAKNVYRAKRKK